MGQECLTAFDTDEGVHKWYHIAKWYYSVHFTLIVVLMWLMRDYGDYAFSGLDSFKVCKDEGEGSNNCFGKDAVLKLAFASFIFFAFQDRKSVV